VSSAGESPRGVSSGRGAPPPRRRGNAEPGDAPVAGSSAAAAPRAATVVSPPPAPGAAGEAREPSRSPAAAAQAGTRAKAPWWLRLVAWIVSVPVGLALVGIPARKLGYLDSQKLLDVVIGDDTGRYLPLAVIVVLWALVTALLVQLIVEGGAWLLRRRSRPAGGAS